MKKFILLFLLFCAVVAADSMPKLPTLREQSEIRRQWLKIRLETALPALMRKYNVSMWLVICREYNEDPVYFSLASPDSFSARRRTILVFSDRGKEGVERLALGGGSHGGLYRVFRDPEMEKTELWGEAQWKLLLHIIEERNPATIAINISRDFPFSDGLSAGEREALQDALGEKWNKRLVRAEKLPMEYLETRIPEMEPYYKQIMEIAHSLIRRAFSNEVIQPGKTTNQDVAWWLRQQVNDLGLEVWFHPGVMVQRRGATGVDFLDEEKTEIIRRGDVLHVDFGIKAMGLNTDTQHMGYVLREGESEVPEGVRKALENTNRLQRIVVERMNPGVTGNEIFISSQEAMKEAGIRGAVYTHPIGDHGHGAGPIIGLWDRQQPVPIRGDLPIIADSWFSIELSAETPVPEWNFEQLWIGLEEDAWMKDGGMQWVLAPQTRFHLVR